MAITQYGVNDALAVKVWARDLFSEVKKGLDIAPLIGTSKSSIIQERSELKGKGDRVTVGLRMQLIGDGKTENETLEGNEESLTTYHDNVVINELNHAVRVEGEDSIDQQRVLHNLREEARMGLQDWFAERLSLSFFVQAAGYTASTMTYRGRTINMGSVYRGLNAVTAPSTNRKIFGGSGLTTDQGVGADSTATFNLNMIDKAKEQATTANPKVRPVRINGKDCYVMYLHPYQVYDLRTSTSDGQWFDIQKAAIMGGQTSGNPIFDGSLGMYNNVIIRESEDVTTGVHSTAGTEEANVRRALFLGAQSASVAFSSKFSKSNPFKWVEKKFDYDKELGVSVQSLMGMKKLIFNSEDFGVFTVSTYAVEH
jgi:N4-gp56 family major capsid protein